jgi:ABC-type phosphate/phosphonate transport system permease subunit
MNVSPNLKELVKLDRLVTITITLVITASITWTMNFNFQNTTINNYNQLNDTIDYRIGELENSTGLSDKQQIVYLKQILREVR